MFRSAGKELEGKLRVAERDNCVAETTTVWLLKLSFYACSFVCIIKQRRFSSNYYSCYSHL